MCATTLQCYSIEFNGNLGNTNLKPLALVDATRLTTQNDEQLVKLLDASSGKYTLTFTFNPRPLTVMATAGSSGTLATATYFYRVTACIGSVGCTETLSSTELSAAVTGPGDVNLTWVAVLGATSYRVYRGTTTGGENLYMSSATNSFDDNDSHATTTGAPPTTTPRPAPRPAPALIFRWDRIRCRPSSRRRSRTRLGSAPEPM